MQRTVNVAPVHETSKRLTVPSVAVEGAVRMPAFSNDPGISGSVLDATGGALIGTLVTAQAPDANGVPVASALSDDQGHFVVHVPAGRWLLTATADAYSSNARHVTAPAHNQVIVMVPASAIAGYVVHAGTNHSVAGVTVVSRSTDGVQSLPVTTTSGEDGSFLLERLSAGHYVLQVRTRSYQSAPIEVDLEVGTTSAPVQLEVSEATWLHADVSLASRPCAGGFVELEGAGLMGTIANTGEVLIEGIPPGHYRANVRCERGRPLSEELVVGNEPVERHWRIDSGLSIYGVAKQANQGPLPGARVACDVRDAGDRPVSAPARAVYSSCTSDTEGRFECDGLSEGEYTCRLQNEISPSLAAADVSVRSGQRSEILLQAPARGTIRMRLAESDERQEIPVRGYAVREADHSDFEAIPHGQELEFPGVPLGTYSLYWGPPDVGLQPVAKVSLTRDAEMVEVRVDRPEASSLRGWVTDEQGMPVLDAWVSAEDDSNPAARTLPVLSDEQGQFVIPGVWPGRFSVKATSPFGEASTHGVSSGATEVLLRVERLGSVSGTVLTQAGDPVRSFDVRYIREATSGGRAQGSDGRFSLTNLKAGQYVLSVSCAAGEATIFDLPVSAGAAVQLSLTVGADALQLADMSAFGEFHASGRD